MKYFFPMFFYDSYCSVYRVASRMKSTPDIGLQNTFFA